MSGAQTGNGKAFEYAIAEALQNATGAPIDFSEASASRARTAFNRVSVPARGFLRDAAAASIGNIVRLEKDAADSALMVLFHPDSDGADGFVEDITLVSEAKQIGISCKYNHDDAKHPRLSEVDFAYAWGMRARRPGRPTMYQNRVAPIFTALRGIMAEEPGIRWSELDDKVGDFYFPVLTAFEKQIWALHRSNPERVAAELFNFSIGRRDFYKTRLNTTTGVIMTQAFNMGGTLSKQVPVTSTPTSIVSIRNSKVNLAAKIVEFNNGTSLKFRIHNGDGEIQSATLKLSVSIHGSKDDLKTYAEAIPQPHKGLAFLF